MNKKEKMSVFKDAVCIKPKLLSMKLAMALMFVGIMQVNAFTYGQKVTLQKKNVKLTSVLKEIQKQSGYNILYDSSLIPSSLLVDINVKDQNINSTLDELLNRYNLTYRIVDKNIILNSKKDIAEIPNTNAVVRQRSITGKVTGEGGENVENVTITEKGTPNSTMSDNSGNYSLNIRSQNPTLVFSIVGYESQEVSATGSTLNVTLVQSLSNLDEVVVVGYGTQKKVNLTGAVATLGGEELESRPIANIGRGLQGQLPGLTVRSQNTAPGSSAPQMRIRGVGTWGDANPLVVIDGIPGGDINILNPDDIESISVLKDAASSSIYGVRGANGVIIEILSLIFKPIKRKKRKIRRTFSKFQQLLRMADPNCIA